MLKNLIIAEKLSSTNDSLRNYPPDTALIAIEQTKGRGRSGKSWLSPKGGLYLSYKKLIPANLPRTLIPILIGICCHKALSMIEKDNLFLKWPNDILNASLNKVGGILIESQKNCFIAGIGINCAQADLKEFTVLENDLDKLWLAKLVLKQIDTEMLNAPSFEQIEAYWKKHSFIQQNDLITANKPDGSQIEAMVSHLGNNGELWVRIHGANKLLALYSEEISQVRKVLA